MDCVDVEWKMRERLAIVEAILHLGNDARHNLSGTAMDRHIASVANYRGFEVDFDQWIATTLHLPCEVGGRRDERGGSDEQHAVGL